jgi:hypothetical protein
LADQVWKKYPLFNDKTISTYNAATIDSLVAGGGLGAYSLDEINNAKGL